MALQDGRSSSGPMVWAAEPHSTWAYIFHDKHINGLGLVWAVYIVGMGLWAGLKLLLSVGTKRVEQKKKKNIFFIFFNKIIRT